MSYILTSGSIWTREVASRTPAPKQRSTEVTSG